MKAATLYRMVTPKHICPFGIKSKSLLKRKGYTVDDHTLNSREEADRFKCREQVETTPQAYIHGKRIGGYEDLRHFFGMKSAKKNGVTYVPVVAIFLTCLLIAVALSWGFYDRVALIFLLEAFVALSMCVLAIQKLRDLYGFTNQFITYDLLSMRFVPYAYVYPFAEAYTGIGMLMGLNALFLSPVAFFIGMVGAVSVIKAVYIEKRELKCACVGGDSKVPLGIISLTENLMMVAAAIWMWVK